MNRDNTTPDELAEPREDHASPAAQIPHGAEQDLGLTILDGLEAMVYVADMQTYELLYVNDYTRRLFGDVVGKRCWETLQEGLTAPCAFCTNSKLVDADGTPNAPYTWEFQNTRDGHWYHITDRAIRWTDGRIVRMEVAFDITSRKVQEESIAHQASHDALTGLLNRHELQEILDKVHAQATRNERPYSVLLFDLDRFKLINDYYGHHVGDVVLKRISTVAERSLRKGDWLGRWGGEEFLCILPDTDPARAASIAERLRYDIEQARVHADGREILITTSVGIATYPTDADRPESLLSNVDSALYEAKRAGRNRVVSCENKGTGVFSIAGQLEEALAKNRLQTAYQPIVELDSRTLIAEEALARLVMPKGEVIGAGRFIQAASDLQIAHKIDFHIITATIGRCSTQVSGGKLIKHFVNLSADLLRHPELVDSILETAYTACNAVGELIDNQKPMVIEITEREFLGDIRNVRNILAPLIDFGLEIAIDDFGSGYSSFQYLADLPVSYLKIEGGLIKRLGSEARVRAIVQGIQDIADDLNLITIAEHIEDEQTLDILRSLNVAWGQGYLFGCPEI